MLRLLSGPTLTSVHNYWKTIITSNIQAFVGKVTSLLSDVLSRFVITFHPRSKCLLIPSLQSPSAVILEPKKIKSVPVSTFSQSICQEVMGLDAMILVLLMLSFKPAFSCSSLPVSRGSLVPLHFLPLEWCHLHIWGCWYFFQQSWFQLLIHPAWHFIWYSLVILLSQFWTSQLSHVWFWCTGFSRDR